MRPLPPPFDPARHPAPEQPEWVPPGQPAGWYPVAGGHWGLWDGNRWVWLPPSRERRNVLGEPLLDIPEVCSSAAAAGGMVAALGLALAMAAALGSTELPSWLALLAAFVPVWAGLGAACVWGARRSGVRFGDTLGLPATTAGWAKAAALGIAAGICVRVAGSIVALPFVPFLADAGPVSLLAQTTPTVDVPDGAALAVFAVGAVVGAPLVEEAFFRNVMLPTMARSWAFPVAVAAQGVVFALAHLSGAAPLAQNLMTVTAITVVGVSMGVLRRNTRTLVTCVVAHATFNAVAVAALAASPLLERLIEAAG